MQHYLSIILTRAWSKTVTLEMTFFVYLLCRKVVAKAFFDFPHVSVVYFGCTSSKTNLSDSNYYAGKYSTQFDEELRKYIFAFSRFGRDTLFFHDMLILF